MIVINKKNSLTEIISKLKAKYTIGFVPTMGALHKGHLSLIKTSKNNNDITVASIFVNPSQFNNPDDFDRYPRTPDTDIKMLEDAGCDYVFMPSSEEMYPEPDNRIFEIGDIGIVMEGKFRPGHFNGVLQIVSRLFDIVPAHRAYFGEKDFQQLCIIRWMVKKYSYPVEIIACPTLREEDGLAMSSRNQLLTETERLKAPLIYKVLSEGKSKINVLSAKEIKEWAMNELSKDRAFRPEYFEIVFEDNLLPVSDWNEPGSKRACVAAWLGNVRLIDNMKYY